MPIALISWNFYEASRLFIKDYKERHLLLISHYLVLFYSHQTLLHTVGDIYTRLILAQQRWLTTLGWNSKNIGQNVVFLFLWQQQASSSNSGNNNNKRVEFGAHKTPRGVHKHVLSCITTQDNSRDNNFSRHFYFFDILTWWKSK